VRLTTGQGSWKIRETTKIKNLRFVFAPTSVPSNLGAHADGLARLAILLPSAVAEWKGEFTVEQWAVLLERGKGLMAPKLAAAPPPVATATTSAASTSAAAASAFAFPQPAAVAWPPPPGQMPEQIQMQQQLVVMQHLQHLQQQQQQQPMPASQLATPRQGGPGRAASADVSQGSLSSARTVDPALTPLDAAGRVLAAGMGNIQ